MTAADDTGRVAPISRIALGHRDEHASGLAFTDDEHIVISVIGKPTRPNVLRFLDLAGNRIAEYSEFTRSEIMIGPGSTVVAADAILDACGHPVVTFDRIRWGELLGVSTDGRYLIRVESGVPRGHAVIEELPDRIEVARSELAASSARGVILPDGRCLTAGHKKSSTVIDIPSGRAEIVKHLRYGWPFLTASPDGRWLAVGEDLKQSFAIVSATDWREQVTIKRTRGVADVAWDPQGRWLVLAERSVISLVDVTTWAVVAEVKVEAGAQHVSVSPSGELIAVTGYGESPAVEIWRADTVATTGLVSRRKPPRRPARKLLQGVFFGVNAEICNDDLAAAARNLHSILDNYPDEFVMLLEDAEIAQGELRWFTFLASRGRTYIREPWIQCLANDLGALEVVCVNERVRRVFARRYVPDVVWGENRDHADALIERLRALRERGLVTRVRGNAPLSELVPRCSVTPDGM
jgi:hypothetical protein